MIPYIEWKTITLGPLTLHVWGLFVALGFLVAALVAGRHAKRNGLRAEIIYDLAAWMVLAGMVGGRLGHVLFYEFPYYLAHPVEVFAIWEGGLSMFGGLIACAIVGIGYLRRKHVDVWRYADDAAFGLPFGMMVGRIGCFLIHDHPGTATDFALGVQYPDGVVRHDHGLYEVINGAFMAVVFVLLARRRPPVGTFIGVFSLWYGLFRFATDFWRLVDTRYLGLTPGQYLGIALAIFGGAVLWITHRQKRQ
ncbi:prolipoprotein diacylglyceryl transferase [Candidatus Uhrbacteria bacterium]|nr:prolipoprotein diacylglyceryl transferase [Candidatus Uhrbacteria bacterium]